MINLARFSFVVGTLLIIAWLSKDYGSGPALGALTVGTLGYARGWMEARKDFQRSRDRDFTPRRKGDKSDMEMN